MEISTNIGYLRKRRNGELCSYEECADILKKAGFKYIDFSGNEYLPDDDWKEKILSTKKYFDKIGLVIDQTHAPFDFDLHDEETNKIRMQRSFEVCKLVGAENIVVHGSNYVPDENGFDFDKGLNAVYDFYAPYVDYAKKEGFGVAIENLCGRHDRKPVLFSCYIEEQKALIDKFNDPSVTACWDFGHGYVTYGEQHLEMLKQFEGKLSCTHVHDNIYSMDLHQFPFFGNCKWEEVVRYLKESGYPGKFTFELVYGCIPDEFIQQYMDLCYKMGEYMMKF